jgi:hypothetical protein
MGAGAKADVSSIRYCDIEEAEGMCAHADWLAEALTRSGWPGAYRHRLEA